MKPGGLIRVHTSALQPNSQYKSLLISEETTSDELLTLLLSCYSLLEPVEQYSLYEVCPGQEYQRKLHPDDLPLRAQSQRTQRGEICHFLVRHNPNYLRRKQLSIVDDDTSSSIVIKSNRTNNSNKIGAKVLLPEFSQSIVIESTTKETTKCLMPNMNNNNGKELKCSTESLGHMNGEIIQSGPVEPCNECTTATASLERTSANRQTFILRKSATKCQRLMCKSCELCRDSGIDVAYSPVYNIREIRTVKGALFSSFGSDKKHIDMDSVRYPAVTGTSTGKNNNINNNSSLVINKNSNNDEPVQKGFANFVYI